MRAGDADTSSCSVVLEVSLISSWSLRVSTIFVRRVDCALRPLRSCAGLGSLLSIGVVRKRNSANSRSCPLCLAFFMTCFTVLIWRSTKPFYEAVDISVKTSHAGMTSSLTGLRSMRWQNVDRFQTRLEKAHLSL